ncbi:MAG: membrane protein insertion efficiency factor YidD [bacterium]
MTLYRVVISPHYFHRCQFKPSCSAYGLRALTSRGWALGGAMAVDRVMRCHPLASASGYGTVLGAESDPLGMFRLNPWDPRSMSRLLLDPVEENVIW